MKATSKKAKPAPKKKKSKAAPARASRASGTDPKRVRAILAKLDEAYPNAHCALNHRNAFELLIATILSAQCTDVRVTMVTPGLFKKYPTPEAFAHASPAELQNEIRSTGFFRNKAKSIMGAGKKIMEDFHGRISVNSPPGGGAIFSIALPLPS